MKNPEADSPLVRAVLYPRVSSLIQKDRHSIASQLHELPLYVERKGWVLVRPPDYYIDDGRSAKTGKLAQRTSFLKLLDDAACKPRQFDVVVTVLLAASPAQSTSASAFAKVDAAGCV